MKNLSTKKIMLLLCLIGIIISAIPECTHHNSGKSKAKGSVGKGSIENPWLVPYAGKNFKYFSPLSYFILNNGYTHSKVYHTLLTAYEECEQTCPDFEFKIMECSNKKGGKMLIHKTHQNGLSIDFMVPKKRGAQQTRLFDWLGLGHYLLEFTNTGKLNFYRKTAIDFETMGRHILALENAARQNGLRIKMVILKIELKDDFYKTKSGRLVKEKGIYFARSLPDLVNRLHDDHYHVDFELVP